MLVPGGMPLEGVCITPRSFPASNDHCASAPASDSPLPYRPVEERVNDWSEVHAKVTCLLVWGSTEVARGLKTPPACAPRSYCSAFPRLVPQLPAEQQAELLNTQSARCMNCGTPYCLNRTTGEQALRAAAPSRHGAAVCLPPSFERPLHA